MKVLPEVQHKKTEVVFRPNSTKTTEDDINDDDTTLNTVQEFTYIGSMIEKDQPIEAEIQNII